MTKYHSISVLSIETVRFNRIYDRAIQNSRAILHCTKSFIKGDLKDTIFTQFNNLPQHEDGMSFANQLTTFTAITFLQLSTILFQNILNVDSSEYKFNILILNGKLINLFVLITTQTRSLLALEHIQHTIIVYSKILQPEAWAQWVRSKVDSFEDGNIAN